MICCFNQNSKQKRNINLFARIMIIWSCSVRRSYISQTAISSETLCYLQSAQTNPIRLFICKLEIKNRDAIYWQSFKLDCHVRHNKFNVFERILKLIWPLKGFSWMNNGETVCKRQSRFSLIFDKLFHITFIGRWEVSRGNEVLVFNSIINNGKK